jgi:DNA-binding transcriptional MocR family regulator
MVKTVAATMWTPRLKSDCGPVYLAIADALEGDIASGRLAQGTRLPPQRVLAERLGIDFTTVTRAYAEARGRGLLSSKVGQGTFVRSRAAPRTKLSVEGGVDLSMNLPPRFSDPALVSRLWRDIGTLEEEGGLDLLLQYQAPGGSPEDRRAAVQWLHPHLPDIAADRLVIAPGAQSALFAIATSLAAPGDTIAAESLCYPGFRALAAQARLTLAPVVMDEQGLLPEALDSVCLQKKPKALYLTPTLHNPTTATMSVARRQAVIAVARRHSLFLIEDDAYGMLAERAPPPLAALASDITWHVAGLAKCLSPALRLAYCVVPNPRAALRLSAAIRATAAMASPLSAAIARNWIENGTAAQLLSAIRRESAERRALVARLLPSAQFRGSDGFHVWLTLPAPWTRGEFLARLTPLGIGAVPSDAFALSAPPEALRLGLGAPRTKDDLAHGLAVIADLLGEPPALSSRVV